MGGGGAGYTSPATEVSVSEKALSHTHFYEADSRQLPQSVLPPTKFIPMDCTIPTTTMYEQNT